MRLTLVLLIVALAFVVHAQKGNGNDKQNSEYRLFVYVTAFWMF